MTSGENGTLNLILFSSIVVELIMHIQKSTLNKKTGSRLYYLCLKAGREKRERDKMHKIN